MVLIYGSELDKKKKGIIHAALMIVLYYKSHYKSNNVRY